MRWTVTTIAGLIALLAGTAGADPAELKICSDPDNLPYSNERQEGFENKIAELIAAKLRVPVRYTWFPQATGFLRNTLRARRCDIVIGMVSGAELVLSTNPYYRSTYVMVTRTADGIKADRLDDPWKRWKTGPEDYRNRAKRKDYLAAMHEMFEQTDTRWAPWKVIDGNNKKAARIAALAHVAEALEAAVPMTPPDRDPAVVKLAHKAFGYTVKD